MSEYVSFDTNVLIDDPECIDKFTNVVLHIDVIKELDKLKLDRDYNLASKARKALKAIVTRKDIEFNIGEYSTDSVDDVIVLMCSNNGYTLYSNDVAVQIKSKIFKVKCLPWETNCDLEYKGYIELSPSPEELAEFYETKENKWGALLNQYVAFNYEGEDNKGNTIIKTDLWKFTDKGFVPVVKKALKSMWLGDIKPKDIHQECAIDSLYNDTLSVFSGKAGSGKTLLSLAYIAQMLQNNKFDKCYIVHNPLKLKGSQDMGFYPGSKNEKMMSSNLGSILSSKFGDSLAIETLINQGKFVVLPASDIRGFEAGENSCIFVTEAQNFDIYMLKTLIQRAKEGCKIIIEGDVFSQVDSQYCAGDRNGMKRMIDVFKGTPEFSCVHLSNIYRSKVALTAENM
jgi:PhoH-like ATPase